MCSGRSSRLLFRLEPGSWQGPIESGYGWHLVWVDAMMASRVPAFEEVEAEVKAEWIAEQRAESRRRAFEAMRARYEVILPKAPAKAAAGAGTLPAREAPVSRQEAGCAAKRCWLLLSLLLRCWGMCPACGAHESRPASLGINRDRARPLRRAVAHAGARRHAPAGTAGVP